MKALLLLLLATGANALSIKAPSPNSTSISPSTITATGTGYSIQATNGSVYAKYGVKASSIALPNGGAVNITNSLDTDQEILSLDSANTVNLGNSSGITDVRIGENVNVILNSSGGDKVGIGTASPATKVHMSSGTLTVDGTGGALSVAGSGTPIVVSTWTATYGSGSAHVCVNDSGQLFVSEAACP